MKFIDAQQMHKDHPTSFEVPDEKELAGIEPGMFVKIGVEHDGQVERFWLKVTKVGVKLAGTVANDLDSVPLKRGEEVKFYRKHVMGLMTEQEQAEAETELRRMRAATTEFPTVYLERSVEWLGAVTPQLAAIGDLLRNNRHTRIQLSMIGRVFMLADDMAELAGTLDELVSTPGARGGWDDEPETEIQRDVREHFEEVNRTALSADDREFLRGKAEWLDLLAEEFATIGDRLRATPATRAHWDTVCDYFLNANRAEVMAEHLRDLAS